jgi:DNA topoisomerase IA
LSISEVLIQCKNAESESGNLVITSRGKAVLEFLLGSYPCFFSVEFPEKMEEEFDEITKDS